MWKWNSLFIVQLSAWILLATLFFFERVTLYNNIETVIAAVINTLLSYALVIYGYIYFVYPVFFKRIPITGFVFIVLIFLCAAAVLQLLIQVFIVYPLSKFSETASPNISYAVISVFIAFIIGMLLQSVVNNIRMSKSAMELKGKQAEAEMKWLKAQVQPHFLFNALNNIYFEATEQSPTTAGLIEKLADIMRYLLEKTAKEKLSLEDEVNFIKNYIEFENLRLHNKVNITFHNNAPSGVLIPPLLFIPLIENIFKHGNDKLEKDNTATVTLEAKDQQLLFSVTNKVISKNVVANGGFGLKNLEERLHLLYGDNFSLHTDGSDNIFKAELKIPLS